MQSVLASHRGQRGTPPAPRASWSRRSFLGAGAGALGGAALLSGCGGTAAGSSSGALQFWQFYAPAPQEDPTAQKQSTWFEDLVATWNAENDRQVELVYIPSAAYLGGTQLPTSFAAEAGPDIFIISPGDFLRYYNGGVLADLTPHLTPEAIEDFFPSSRSTRFVGDRAYALPMEVEPLAILYSVRVWEEAGLSEGDIPTTWDQLLDVGDRLRAPGRAGLVLETNPGYYQNFTFYPWMWQAGGEVLDPTGTSSALDGPGLARALDFWQTAVRSGISPRTLPAAGDVAAGLSGGQAGMWHSGIWNVAAFRDNHPDVPYGVFRHPPPEGGEYTTDLGGWSFVANARGRDPDTAARFCAWALGSMESHSIERMADWCVNAKSDIAPRASVQELATAMGGFESGAMRTFAEDVFPGGRAEPRYPPVVYKIISDAVQACMLAGADPRAESEVAGRAVDAYLQTYEGAPML